MRYFYEYFYEIQYFYEIFHFIGKETGLASLRVSKVIVSRWRNEVLFLYLHYISTIDLNHCVSLRVCVCVYRTCNFYANYASF